MVEGLQSTFPMIKKIQIKKGIFYEVVFDEEIPKSDYGYCLSRGGDDHGVVAIRPGLSRKATQATLVHEIIHAADFEWKIKLTEKQTLQLEAAFLTLLRLNKMSGFMK